MSRRQRYLILAIIGFLVPYSQFALFVRESGLNLSTLIAQVLATHASAFFALDVIVSTIVLWAFIRAENKRVPVKHVWAPLLASLLVGVSLAFPLYLYLREPSDSAQRERPGDTLPLRSP